MLDRRIMTLSEKNNKFQKQKNMNFLLGLPLPTLLRCHDPSLEMSTTRSRGLGYTLIPRPMMSNIMVFAIIHADIQMDLTQRRHTNIYYHANNTLSSTVIIDNNNNNNNNDDVDMAACNGDVVGVREAVSRNREVVWRKDNQGNIPLHRAVEKGRKDVAGYLIQVYPQGSYALNHFGESPLYLAVVKGHMDLVNFMLENLATDAEATKILSKTNKSIIFAAITDQNQEMVRIILKHQPKLIKTINKEGWSPLSYASYKGLTDIVSFFLGRFGELVQKDVSYPIHQACKGGHVHILQIFYSHCPSHFTKPDQNGLTILHHAAKAPHNALKDVVSYLLSLQEISRKLVKMKDQTRRTPFDLARFYNNHQVMQLFPQNRTA